MVQHGVSQESRALQNRSASHFILTLHMGMRKHVVLQHSGLDLPLRTKWESKSSILAPTTFGAEITKYRISSPVRRNDRGL